MKICINDLLYAFSYALDCVEHDVIGVSTYHGPRVAAISVAMGKALGLSQAALLDLAACAILHDNALTEYIQEERSRGADILKHPEMVQYGSHCSMGERNLRAFPFQTETAGFILYHHENADGTGPFHKTARETPLGAQIIHLADQLDAAFDLSYFTEEKYARMRKLLEESAEKIFSAQCAALFLQGCPPEYLTKLHRARAIVVLKEALPAVKREYTQGQVIDICGVMAKIIDYKSEFTRRHSIGIAQKAIAMGRFYQADEQTQTKLYFAGALHDVGKLIVDSNILEKPAKLTDQEYLHIQNHAYKTYEILSQIDGLGEVVGWASNHHERLNGKGYPFKKQAPELGKMDRLLACLDVYQALTEERPYKQGMEHQKAVGILRDMAESGMLDREVIADIDTAYTMGCFE